MLWGISNNLFFRHQYGFMKNKNTTQAIVSLVHSIQELKNQNKENKHKNNIITVVFIDYKKPLT